MFKTNKMSKSRRKMTRNMRREADKRRKSWDDRNGDTSYRSSWQEQVEEGTILLFTFFSFGEYSSNWLIKFAFRYSQLIINRHARKR